MKRLGLLLSILSIGIALVAANTVYSVKAQDSGKASSRIVIKASDTGGYTFGNRQGTITITIPNGELATKTAEYRRLSHIIDYISLSQDNANSYITIKTMGDFRVEHYSTATGIIVDVVNPLVKPPVPEAVTAISKPSMNPIPKPADKPSSEQPKAEPAKPDTLKPQVTKPAMVKVPYKITPIPFWDNMAMAIEPDLELYGVALFLMLTILIILIFPKCARAPKQKKPVADLGLNGATLIMDAETKVRMVTKLLNEGWTSRQISKEMKIPIKEVEMLVSRAQFSDHSKH